MTTPGDHMKREMAQGVGAFAHAASQNLAPLNKPSAIYTFARGSSDAVANILSYEFMRRLKIPMTSLPPSVFSLGMGVEFSDDLALVISQSGASDDLIACTKGAKRAIAITNVSPSPVEEAAEITISANAGTEQAVPATKTVMGCIGAGMALLAAFDPDYKAECTAAACALQNEIPTHPRQPEITNSLFHATHVYVIGRQAGLGTAQEVALKLKETCAIHAEAYSASEVLHGPLQLVSRPMTVLILDVEDATSKSSLDAAEARFTEYGAKVLRVAPSDVGLPAMAPPAQAVALLHLMYPVIHALALKLGFDPDTPDTLKKVTVTT